MVAREPKAGEAACTTPSEKQTWLPYVLSPSRPHGMQGAYFYLPAVGTRRLVTAAESKSRLPAFLPLRALVGEIAASLNATLRSVPARAKHCSRMMSAAEIGRTPQRSFVRRVRRRVAVVEGCSPRSVLFRR